MEVYTFLRVGSVLAGMITFLLVYGYTLRTVAMSVKRKEWGMGWFLMNVFPVACASAISFMVVKATFIF